MGAFLRGFDEEFTVSAAEVVDFLAFFYFGEFGHFLDDGIFTADKWDFEYEEPEEYVNIDGESDEKEEADGEGKYFLGSHFDLMISCFCVLVC